MPLLDRAAARAFWPVEMMLPSLRRCRCGHKVVTYVKWYILPGPEQSTGMVAMDPKSNKLLPRVKLIALRHLLTGACWRRLPEAPGRVNLNETVRNRHLHFAFFFPLPYRLSKYPGRSWPGNGGYGIANFRQPRKSWRTTRTNWLGPLMQILNSMQPGLIPKSDYGRLPGLFLVSFQSTCLHSLLLAHLSFSRTFRFQIVPPVPP